MLASATCRHTIVRGRARWPGDEICDGTAPCLSILVLAAARKVDEKGDEVDEKGDEVI